MQSDSVSCAPDTSDPLLYPFFCSSIPPRDHDRPLCAYRYLGILILAGLLGLAPTCIPCIPCIASSPPHHRVFDDSRSAHTCVAGCAALCALQRYWARCAVLFCAVLRECITGTALLCPQSFCLARGDLPAVVWLEPIAIPHSRSRSGPRSNSHCAYSPRSEPVLGRYR